MQLRWEGPAEVLRRSELLDEETGARCKVSHPRYAQGDMPVTIKRQHSGAPFHLALHR